MKRLDQGNLHPIPEVPRLTCLGWESNQASEVGGENARKEPFKYLVNMQLFRTSMSPRQSIQMFLSRDNNNHFFN
jgi:hypothetical protein